MIKQIIEKYNTERSFTTAGGMTIHYTGIVPDKFPALEQELEQEMEKRAVAFAEWTRQSGFKQFSNGNEWFDNKTPGNKIGPIFTTAELYDRFKFEQWAEREGYTKTHMGWTKDEVMFISNEQLYTQFKQEAK